MQCYLAVQAARETFSRWTLVWHSLKKSRSNSLSVVWHAGELTITRWLGPSGMNYHGLGMIGKKQQGVMTQQGTSPRMVGSDSGSDTGLLGDIEHVVHEE